MWAVTLLLHVGILDWLGPRLIGELMTAVAEQQLVFAFLSLMFASLQCCFI